jgi:hypothetical protein
VPISTIPSATIIKDELGHRANVEDGNLDVLQHAHSDAGVAHFHLEGITGAATYTYLIIDLSDTTNYPHDYTSVIHIDWIKFEVASDVTGDYLITWGVVENVDATDGDYYIIDHISGSRIAGNSVKGFYEFNGAGWTMDSARMATGHTSLNDVTFQTDVNLPTTLSPGVAATPPGDGDLIMQVVLAAGTIDVICTVGYHTHSPDHN